jgi:hypothetical protein
MAIGIHAVDEHVAARAKAAERKILPFEERLVVVAVADGDAFADLQQFGVVQPAVRAVHRVRKGMDLQDVSAPVAVTEAEAGFAIT